MSSTSNSTTTATTTAFDYAVSPYAIPDEKPEAYRQAWAFIAAPGAWWSGEEHVAIAAAARRAASCTLCASRRTALSPQAVSGDHDGIDSDRSQALPAKVVDAVHRIRTDPARLTRTWLSSLIDADFSYGHYVEMVGVIVTLVAIDSFNEVLGLDLESLPAPTPGKPTGYTPAGARIDVAWVPMIYPDALTEAEADIYFGAPQTGNVIRAMSLVPDAVRMLHTVAAAQYVPTPEVMTMSSNGSLSLSRPQIELVAARTSALNDCFY